MNTTTIKTTDTNNQQITLQQFFDFIKKSDDEKLDDVITIKPSTQKYIRIFKEHGDKKFFWSWNWSGFLFGFLWMVYRKMYAMVFKLILYSVLSIIALLLTGGLFYLLFKFVFHLSDEVMYTIAIVCGIPLYIFGYLSTGLLSNWLYLNHVKKCIHKNKWKKAGVSKKALFAVIVLVPVLIIVAAMGYEVKDRVIERLQQKDSSISAIHNSEDANSHDETTDTTNL